jgi:benzylsuccinate CoA-transferase BbsF subunit
VISVFSDAEWRALCAAMGNPAWTNHTRFVTASGRKANEDELDRRIGEWTARYGSREVTDRIQAAGLRAGIVNTMKDLFSDPQLTPRGQWKELEHPEIGKMHYQRPPFILTKTPPGPSRRDPLLGEHNDYFYKEILGLPEKEFRDFVSAGVID